MPSSLSGGCASNPKQAAQEDIDKAGPETGLVVGTYARDESGARFDNESFYFRQVGKRKRYQIGFSTLPFVSINFDFSGADGCGNLFVIPVPAGRYEFNDFYVNYTMLGGGMTLSSEKEYSIPFEVKPGKIVYVGEIRIERTKGASLLGLYSQDSVDFRISDAHERDLEIFKKLYPGNKMDVDLAKYDSAAGTSLVKVLY